MAQWPVLARIQQDWQGFWGKANCTCRRQKALDSTHTSQGSSTQRTQVPDWTHCKKPWQQCLIQGLVKLGLPCVHFHQLASLASPTQLQHPSKPSVQLCLHQLASLQTLNSSMQPTPALPH